MRHSSCAMFLLACTAGSVAAGTMAMSASGSGEVCGPATSAPSFIQKHKLMDKSVLQSAVEATNTMTTPAAAQEWREQEIEGYCSNDGGNSRYQYWYIDATVEDCKYFCLNYDTCVGITTGSSVYSCRIHLSTQSIPLDATWHWEPKDGAGAIDGVVPANGKTCSVLQAVAWQHVEGVWCSDYSIQFKNKEYNQEECKALCNEDSDCVGVAVTTSIWNQNNPAYGYCSLCKTSTTTIIGRMSIFDVYWKARAIASIDDSPGAHGNGKPNMQDCQGDCDSDNDCAGTLVCFQRSGTGAFPMCTGTPYKDWDYCYDPTPRPQALSLRS